MILFTLPEDQERIPAWIDEQLISPNLRRLATEISAVHDTLTEFDVPSRDEMQKWLGDRFSQVLERGTAALDRDRIRQLLTDPRLLFGLQHLMIDEGGDYWTDLALARADVPLPEAGAEVSREAATAAEIGPAAVADTLPTATGEAAPSRKPDAIQTVSKWTSTPLPRYLAALAASLAVAIGAWSLTRPAPQWGWNRGDALADAGDAAAYLERLADAAGEWSAARPTTEARLKARLDELLAGCDRLIASPHRALAEADRKELVKKCQTWREKIAGHVEALARSHDVEAVRGEADETVGKLITALRKQAGEIRARSAPPA